tara:strand:- start:1797 stop:1946 length:150 start_codon:yes stop_codon:yes gene_type:complete
MAVAAMHGNAQIKWYHQGFSGSGGNMIQTPPETKMDHNWEVFASQKLFY